MGSFILSLSEDNKRLVAQNAKKNRPKYYSPELQALQDQASSKGLDPKQFDPYVEISEDFEAMLIILPASYKQALVSSLKDMLKNGVPEEELALMQEVVAIRKESYAILSGTFAKQNTDFDNTYSGITSYLASLFSPQTEQKETAISTQAKTAPVVSDLGRLFSVMSSFLYRTTKAEVLGVHDVIVDQLTLFEQSAAFRDKQKELSSWVFVVSAYNILSQPAR